MGFISSRLRRGFLSVLQLVIARAVLDTSSWRVEVDPKWVVQHGQTDCPCKTAHIQPGPRPPTAPEAAPAVLLAINRVQGVSRGAPPAVSNESECWSLKMVSSRWDIIKI